MNKFREIVKNNRVWYAEVHSLKRVGHNLASEQKQVGSVVVFLIMFVLPTVLLFTLFSLFAELMVGKT